MALRQERPDQSLYEEHLPKEQQATYQEYQARKPYENRLRELLFFVNLYSVKIKNSGSPVSMYN